MKTILKSIFLFTLITELLLQCANPASPTGGPKDTIPPVLIQSYPVSGQTNFKENEFILEFSEIVSADQLTQKIITTPKTDVRFKTLIRKNTLTIRFENEFKDSTTYNFNFADGVVDITEKNPVENLSIAFSTGNFIDSMKLSGQIIDLFTQEPASKYTVGLYPITDSLDLLRDSPVYFATTSDSGTFSLSYIKSDNYKLLAFLDDNKNIKFDAATEPHGFLQGILQLDSAIQLFDPISTVLQDVNPIKFINSRSIGPYIELKYNKQIDDYSINQNWNHNVFGENKDGIRIYPPGNITYNDSIRFIANVSDSLGNTTIDTVTNVFQDNYRRPTTYSSSLTKNEEVLLDTITASLLFNKPSFISDSIRISLVRDSTFSFSPQYSISWNSNLTKAKLSCYLDKASVIERLIETLSIDTTSATPTDLIDQNFNLDLRILKGSFHSIESDTSKELSISYRTRTSSKYGTIKLGVQTNEKSFVLQLTSTGGVVKYSIKNEKNAKFSRVTPGKYNIRVLIDDNQDGQWSVGNLLNDIPPESIFIYPETTTVRENWEQEIYITF